MEPWAVVLVVALVALILGAHVLADRRHRRAPEPRPDLPRLPAGMVGAERTWVVFTAPYCASCGPVTEQLRAADPGADVVTVDASRDTGLADAYSVRSAPTVLLADASGEVQARLVGARAVASYVRRPQ